MKKTILALALVLVGVFAAGLIHSRTTEASVDRYCVVNSVVNCGVYNQSELNNAKADAKAAYKHFGIPTDLSKAVQGTVKKNGTVVVNGKVVATGVKSMGRTDYTSDSKPLMVGGTKFYTRSVTNSLDHDESAYVFFDSNGIFMGAIMKACGNPAWGEKVKPSYKCESMNTPKMLSRTKVELGTVRASMSDGVKLTKTEYVITNSAGKQVYRGTNRVHNITTPGTYTVKATLTFSVNGKTVTRSSSDCVKKFTVKEEPKIKVCDLKAGKLIVIKESEFNSKLHSKKFADCKIKVCELETSTIKTIWKYQFDSKKHTRDLSKCDKIEVCIIADKTGEMITIKPHEFDESIHSTDVDDCKEVPPVVPPEVPEQPLPETGAAGTIGLISGVSALGAGGYHFFQRRRLNK